MVNKNNKILKRLMPIICVAIVVVVALITPVSAVINSSQGPFNDYDITGRSTFPLTVGFSYATRDLSTGAGASYVYSTYVGQYGVEFNQTENGAETYTYKYDAYGDGSTVVNQTGELLYTLQADEWQDAIEVENSGTYRYGKKRITMSNSNFTTGNIAGMQQGVVLRADDIVFNPHTVVDSVEVTVNNFGQEVYEYTYKDDITYAVPSFLTPNTLEYTNNLGIEIVYSWSCDVVDANGNISHHSNYAVYDNRAADYDQEVIPIIDAVTLANQIGGLGNGGKLSPTIIIQNYYGYLEYKYYAYVGPQIEFTIDGITYACPDGMTWGDYAVLDSDDYPAITNAPLRFIDSTAGTGMQYNNNGIWQFILYQGEYVQDDDLIIGRGVYTLQEIVDLAGTWIFNDIISLDADSEYLFNFTSNGASYYGLKNHVDTERAYMAYKRANGVYRTVYESALFSDDGYKTIDITSNVDDVTNGADLLSWLTANATKVTAATTSVADESSTPTAEYTATTTGTWTEIERSESAEFVLWYPLIDTSGIIINNSNAYNDWYTWYSFPDMSKYIYTFGVEPPDMTFDFTSWIGTAVGGFLNMEIMPNFSIGGVLAILVAFALVMLFLKFFAGG